MPRYNPAVIEPKWQAFWERNRTFKAPELPGTEGPAKEKVYVLDMFPYPSGEGLHVGHPEGYTATDIVCRYHRMRGKSVLHPMGFDAFGLPAEERAIKTGVPPQVSTAANIDNFRRQLKSLGFSYDWDRELATTDVAYFRWTQWIFLKLYDTWFDPEQQKGRPIAELPIPADVQAAGADAVAAYQDSKRLAYESTAAVNWCPALGTVLANEEVIQGVSERGGHPVVRLPLRQWMLKITAYADRLEKDLEQVDWPESVKALQRNWIGRSTGAEVDFFIGGLTAGGTPAAEAFDAWKKARAAGGGFPVGKPGDDAMRIYTTRPDTLFGATYMVLAPEHPLVSRLTTPDRKAAVEKYIAAAAGKSDLDRTELAKKKTGEFTGGYAINPVDGQPIPIWIADYVLAGYGTGAIMAVPAHDERDFEFAQQFGLPIVAVVDPGDSGGVDRAAVLAGEAVFPDHGVAVNSSAFDGLSTAEFKTKITESLAADGVGRGAVNYKLRDWIFSRQRFWGEPFPLLHELGADGKPNGRVRPVPDDQLPVELPKVDDYKPLGRPEPLLEKAPESWLYVELDGKRYKRETNTMPQWAGSCWYYLRFIDPKNSAVLVDPVKEKAWMPVDLYIGGAEHAVLHLLYARFWHKVLFDRGVVTTPEPFKKLVNQGMILGETEHTAFQTPEHEWIGPADLRETEDGKRVVKATGVEVNAVRIPVEQLEKKGEGFVLAAHPEVRVESRSYKMSKSRGNVVNPTQIVEEFGADSLRLYEMFMGPLEATKPWRTTDVNGLRGFLDRVWRLVVDSRSDDCVLSEAVVDVAPSLEENRVLHKTIQAVTRDVENLSFNTAIARMMEFTNHFTKLERRPKEALEKFVLILAPFAPHLAEELWHVLGHAETLAYEPWPAYDEAFLKEDTVELAVQVLGKVRGKVSVPVGADEATMAAAAQADEKVAPWLVGKTILKTICVPGRLVNFVVK